jgi:ABC-type Zn uptake system ZnuABC Zn-binding protein ZnuA
MLLLAALVSIALAGGCQMEGKKEEIKVVVSTTMVEAVVREIGADRVRTTSLVPADKLPEEFEPTGAHLKDVAQADLVILSGWEEWLPEVTEAIENPGNLALTSIPADLMLPYYHLDAADSVTEALVRKDPDGEVFYRFNRNDYRSRLAVETEDLCASMFGLGEVRVICSEAQADFLDWMGFDIVGTYGLPEDLAGEEKDRLIEVGRRNGVRLVVDDFHMGRNTGKRIADEIGAARVVLTRYPRGVTYLGLLRDSAEKLLFALD